MTVLSRVLAKIEGQIDVEALGEFMLKGFHRPISAHNVLALRQDAMDGVTSAAPI